VRRLHVCPLAQAGLFAPPSEKSQTTEAPVPVHELAAKQVVMNRMLAMLQQTVPLPQSFGPSQSISKELSVWAHVACTGAAF
jgi:hypothetical protein